MFPAITEDPLPVYAGDTTDFTFVVKTPDGEPYDFSPWDQWSCMWRGADGTEIFLEMDLSRILEGALTIHMTAEMTRQMTGGGTFDVQAKQGETVRTFIRSKTKRTLDVTP